MLLICAILSLALASIVSLLVRKRLIQEILTVLSTGFTAAASSIIAYKVATFGDYAPYPCITLDALGALVLWVVSIVGFAAAVYAVTYFRSESIKGIIGRGRTTEYYVLVNIFLLVMVLALSISYPVPAWIFLEATTLSTALLISFYDRRSTIEAAWKYLIMNSVGLTLGFFGMLLYFVPLIHGETMGFVDWHDLMSQARNLDPELAKIAFVFVLIGFGTKIGLAPMHTWKPDAYSKTPATIGALFSGALMPVAFVILLRFKDITDQAAGADYSQKLFMFFGLASVIIAALNILTVKNYKRMLAYSSIEHAGLIAIGFGLGGLGALAATLHLVYHSIIKAALFFGTGNLMIKYGSSKIESISGVVKTMPVTATIIAIGFLAITGMPPFGLFFTEIMLFGLAIVGHPLVVALVLACLAVIFIGFFRQIAAMLFGKIPRDIKNGELSWSLWIVPVMLLAGALVFSLFIPDFLQTLISRAAVR